ncbi:MAG: hypothetical protein IT372_00675 [Polyangiaceae bacterium]|nr:hypothetical protein [Polyangiaceae bacterium]
MKTRPLSASIVSLLSGGALLGTVTLGGCAAESEEQWDDEPLAPSLGTAEGELVSGPDGMPVNCTDDRIIAGHDRVVFPFSNANGAYSRYPYYCQGDFWIDTRDSSWTSGCSTGWQQVSNPWTISCIDAYVSGQNKTVFPVANAVGGYNKDAYRCDGNFWIDTRGSSFTSSCSTGWKKVQNLGCGTPTYQPTYWSSVPSVKANNNCYNYATNKRTDTFAQPGRAAGATFNWDINTFVAAVTADGLQPLSDPASSCPSQMTKVVAFFQTPGGIPVYHFARQDANGLWSHKNAGQAATNLDASGNLITNPLQLADPGDQVRYFCTCSDPEQGLGHVRIE